MSTEPRCPRDANVLTLSQEAGTWSCRCGFSFTLLEWQESPHKTMAEFIYDLGRGEYTPPGRESKG